MVDSTLATPKANHRMSGLINELPNLPNDRSIPNENIVPNETTFGNNANAGEIGRKSISLKPDSNSLMQAKGRLRAPSVTQNGVLITNRRLSNVAAGLPPPKPDAVALLNAKDRLKKLSISKNTGEPEPLSANPSVSSSQEPQSRKQSLIDGLIGRKQSVFQKRGSNSNLSISKNAGESEPLSANPSASSSQEPQSRKQSLMDGLIGRKQSVFQKRGSNTSLSPTKSNSSSVLDLAKSNSNESVRSVRDLRESDKNQSRKGSMIGSLFQKALGLKKEEEEPLPSPEEIARLIQERDREMANQASVGDSVLTKAEKKALEMGSDINIAQTLSRPGSPSVRHKTVKAPVATQGSAPAPKSSKLASNLCDS